MSFGGFYAVGFGFDIWFESGGFCIRRGATAAALQRLSHQRGGRPGGLRRERSPVRAGSRSDRHSLGPDRPLAAETSARETADNAEATARTDGDSTLQPPTFIRLLPQ